MLERLEAAKGLSKNPSLSKHWWNHTIKKKKREQTEEGKKRENQDKTTQVAKKFRQNQYKIAYLAMYKQPQEIVSLKNKDKPSRE